MFEVPEIPASFNNKRTPIHNGYHLKDIASYQDKRTSFNNVSFINNQSPLSNNNNHNNIKSSTSLSDREDRNKRIVSIIKDMTASSSHTGQTDGSSSEANKDGVSIRDISLSFTDCSEKTIQRDLNALVSKVELKKVGSKRWSRYSLNSTPNNQ